MFCAALRSFPLMPRMGMIRHTRTELNTSTFEGEALSIQSMVLMCAVAIGFCLQKKVRLNEYMRISLSESVFVKHTSTLRFFIKRSLLV